MMFRRPAWWAVLLTVTGVLAFVWLGLWQLDRANQKQALIDRYAAATHAPPQPFARMAAAPPADEFPRVRVHGHYLPGRVYLLDNPHHDERGGVQVYAPLRLDGQRRLLLVDLGFLVGNGSDRAPVLPDLPDGERTLQGLYLPPPGVGYRMGGDALAQQVRWPKTTVYLDLDQVARDLGEPLYPRVLALDAAPGVVYQRRHELDPSLMSPTRHRAYAFQWFTFAAAALLIFVVLQRKPRRRASSSLGGPT